MKCLEKTIMVFVLINAVILPIPNYRTVLAQDEYHFEVFGIEGFINCPSKVEGIKIKEWGALENWWTIRVRHPGGGTIENSGPVTSIIYQGPSNNPDAFIIRGTVNEDSICGARELAPHVAIKIVGKCDGSKAEYDSADGERGVFTNLNQPTQVPVPICPTS